MSSKQHIVQRALLSNFCHKDNFLFVILKGNDHRENKIDDLSTGNLFHKNNYLPKDYDDKFREVEPNFPSIIHSLTDIGISSIDVDKKEQIIKYMAYQVIRCKGVRGIAKTKEIHVDAFDVLIDIMEFLGALEFDLITKRDSDPDFVIGDSPILYDPTGFGVYFPVSPQHCFWLHISQSKTPLKPIYINELQYLSAVDHIGAYRKDTLQNILDNPVTESELNDLEDSYWKCVLITKNPDYCRSQHTNSIHIKLIEAHELVQSQIT